MIDEITMGIDHHAVQGGLALALAALSLLTADWLETRQLGGEVVEAERAL